MVGIDVFGFFVDLLGDFGKVFDVVFGEFDG